MHFTESFFRLWIRACQHLFADIVFLAHLTLLLCLNVHSTTTHTHWAESKPNRTSHIDVIVRYGRAQKTKQYAVLCRLLLFTLVPWLGSMPRIHASHICKYPAHYKNTDHTHTQQAGTPKTHENNVYNFRAPNNLKAFKTLIQTTFACAWHNLHVFIHFISFIFLNEAGTQ